MDKFDSLRNSIRQILEQEEQLGRMSPENSEKSRLNPETQLDQKTLENQTIDRAREHPEDAMEQEDFDSSEGDAFEEIYKGEVSKSGQAILPSKRSRKVPTPNMKVSEDSEDDDDFSEESSEIVETEVNETTSEEQSS